MFAIDINTLQKITEKQAQELLRKNVKVIVVDHDFLHGWYVTNDKDIERAVYVYHCYLAINA